MRGRALVGWAATASLFGATNAATCTSDKVIDDFSQWSSNTNSLGSYTSDDGSMSSISAANGVLTFTPNTDDSSFFYETFDCVSNADGYNAITFPVSGPADASFTLELQSATSCSASTYSSYYYTVSGLTTAMQTKTVPLSEFPGANLQTITAWLLSDFSKAGSYSIGEMSFVCAAASGTGSSDPVSSTASSSETTTSGSASGSPSSTVNVLATTTSSTSVAASTTGACTNLLIDDWASQSRLTFLYYNAMLQPSSDDGTMTSVVVANNHVTLTPKTDSYFYSQFNCIKASGVYGGIGLKITAAAGTTFQVELQSSSSCSTENNLKASDQSTSQLGWTFDGTERDYYIPFSKFSGIDTTKLVTIIFQSFNRKAVTFGPMAFYCGDTGSQYIVPPTSTVTTPTGTVPATSGTATAFVIDQFAKKDSNALGFWHGSDDDTQVTIGSNKLTIKFNSSDLAYYTQVTDTCRDMTNYDPEYLHVVYSGPSDFSIALLQHNSACNESSNPYPETWDEVEAGRYATATDIYVPLAHFSIIKTRVIGIAFKGFTSTTATVFTKVEIVKTVPSGVTIPVKIPTAPLIFACTRPNSFAFAIDDGDPQLAQQVADVIRNAGIHVTFFTVGAALLDTSNNLTNVYKEMLSLGHQVAYHSFTHPYMEGLGTYSAIDWEIQNDIDAVTQTLGLTSKYFRPPFGNEGAKVRERAAALIPDAQLIMWDVDVEDWLWALTDTPEKQIDSFKSDLGKGGNLVVMHYLYPTTVSYLQQFIDLAKATGKQLMRVDQCMQDPNAPPL